MTNQQTGFQRNDTKTNRKIRQSNREGDQQVDINRFTGT